MQCNKYVIPAKAGILTYNQNDSCLRRNDERIKIMVMIALRDGASGGILKYFLLGILALAGGGLIFTDVGGFFRGGVSGSDVAKIGSATISAQEFDRTLRSNLQPLQMTPQQAYALGYVHQVLNNEIRASLTRKAAQDYGIAFGEQALAEEVQNFLMPLTQSGQSTEQILNQFLRARGMSERQMVSILERDLTVNTFTNALAGGFAAQSETLSRDLALLDQEVREIEYIEFKDADFKDAPEPNDQELMEFYELQKERFAIAEKREAQIITINTDELSKSVEISEEELKEIYENDIESYSHPETREIEFVLLTDESEASDVAQKANDGQALKAALEAVVQNTTDFIPGKFLRKEEVSEELREEAFAAAKGDIIGPVETALGFQVIKVTDIQEAHTDSFDSIKKDLKTNIMADRTLDARYELANIADDLLASGLSPEELSEELSVNIQTLGAVNRLGTTDDRKRPLENYANASEDVLQTLFDLLEGEASPIIEMEDGTMFAIALKSITPKSYTPFEDAKAALSKQWVDDQKRNNNRAFVNELRSAVVLGEKTFADLNKEHKGKTVKLTRNDEAKAPLSADAKTMLFDAPLNDPVSVDVPGGKILAIVTSSKLPESVKEDDIKTSQETLNTALQNEGYGLFIDAKNKKYGARINDALLKQLYAEEIVN